MEKLELTTFEFDAEHLDEYQRGFISGIMYVLSGRPSSTQRWCKSKDNDGHPIWIKDLDCTADQGLEIAKEIEKHFPKTLLCIS